MAAVDFVTGYITNYVDGLVRPYVEQGAAAVGDVAGGVLFSVGTLMFDGERRSLTSSIRQVIRLLQLVGVWAAPSMDIPLVLAIASVE